MIYASLRTIRQWHQPLTAPIYVVLGLASGAVLLNLLLALFGVEPRGPTGSPSSPSSSPPRSNGLLAAGSTAKRATYTAEAATGLGHLGKVRPWSRRTRSPTSCMREMGYRVARKHAVRLRRLALLLAFALA